MPEQDKEQPQEKAAKKEHEKAGSGSRIALILSIVALVVAVAAGATSGFIAYQQSVAAHAAPPNINAPAKNSTLLHGQWVQVSLVSGNHYYGRLSYDQTLGAYLLWNAWWNNTPSSSESTSTAAAQTTYSKVGSELYKPLPYMVINPQALSTWQELPASSSVLQEIKITAGYTDVVEPKAEDIKNAKYSAVFLTDQSVLYGTIVRDGTQTGVKNAFVMMRKNASANSNQPITSLDDLQLVPEKDITRGVGDTLWLNPSVLVNYVTLSDQSPVVRAIQNQ